MVPSARCIRTGVGGTHRPGRMEHPFETREIGYHRDHAGSRSWSRRSSRPETNPSPSISSSTACARASITRSCSEPRARARRSRSPSVIAQVNRPTLVLAHNKTLAAQLYAEFREFFPDNAVEYFVSYFDYYQPEAYLPRSRHVHREGLEPERRDRPAAPRRDARPVRATRRDHRGVRVVHLRPGRARWTTARPSCGCGSAASTGATPSCATWSTSSTSATTRPCRAPGSASAATPWNCSRRRRRPSSGSSSSATRWSGSPSWTR